MALVLSVPGVKSCSVVGGEKIGRYGEVHIVVLPDPGLADNEIAQVIQEVTRALEDKRVVAIALVVDSAIFVYVDLSIKIWASPNAVFSSINQALNSVTDTYFQSLEIGIPVKYSDLVALYENVEGVDMVELSFTCRQQATDEAGSVTLRLFKNTDASTIHVISTIDKTEKSFTYNESKQSIRFEGAGSFQITYGLANDSVFLQANQIAKLGFININFQL
jgi:uncharacterized phage protein gp47/JayE